MDEDTCRKCGHPWSDHSMGQCYAEGGECTCRKFANSAVGIRRRPTKPVLKVVDKWVQTIRIKVQLACGHETTFTRPAHRAGDIPKAIRCYKCQPVVFEVQHNVSDVRSTAQETKGPIDPGD